MEKLREIEDIVPDFEACRKIPADAFQNTVFRWDEIECIKEEFKEFRFRLSELLEHLPKEAVMDTARIVVFSRNHPEYCFPAPTLEEIFDAICELPNTDFTDMHIISKGKCYSYPTDAGSALDLYLKLKGTQSNGKL